MDGASLEITLGRIEAAIARIENAIENAPAVDGDLQTRHAQLRMVVGQSLRQLDELLGEDRA